MELERLPKELFYLRFPQSYRYLEDNEYEIIKAFIKNKEAITSYIFRSNNSSVF